MIVLVILVGAGLALLAVSVWTEGWRQAIEVAAGNRAAAIWTGAGLLVVGLCFAMTGFRRRRREKFLSFDSEGGTVSISTEAISEYISRLAGEFPAIVRMKPRVRPARKAIDIIIELKVKAGTQVHEVCDLLHQRVRESVTNGLGISEIRRIEVSVREIVSEHRPG
jgi:uncharacterized alkaline shock family protein YloU